MYLFWYRLRIVLTILIVAGVAGGIFYFIQIRTYEDNLARYNIQVTAAVATAIQDALYNVTRTAEAPLNPFRLVQLGQNENLEALALNYGTTLEILQIVNGLGPEVVVGNGETIVVPVGIQTLEPLRTFTVYTAQSGDTLRSIAERNSVPLTLLEHDNPLLAQRGVSPGDLVFVGLVL